ncbi:MAG: alginate O-acetyltransferase [Rhodospirillaceae bacterium BRH_c57]|nr:MAG: alginate O-acetyltransferase [Rhodospirillaceae bacterium BRH_c57]
MLFSSHAFLFAFLPSALVGFFVIGQTGRTRAALGWLVVMSLVFYGWWEPAYLLVLIGSMLFNYGIGSHLAVQALRHGPRPNSARLVLALGIGTNLALLGYFKYANFFVENVNAALATAWSTERLLLPLAISFFTFQQIAFLIEAWRGEVTDRDPLRYALFVSFFPQLIAGPIVHHREMIPQFARLRTFVPRFDALAVGLTIFAIGLFKKTVLADGMAAYADPLFTAAESGIPLTITEGWLAALAYTFQLYFDFSGYSDMAIGLARLFGVDLPINFNSPYKAVNIADFWRRWHMTLSRFLRDYIYIPLGGGRKGPSRRHVNLMTTMLLGGLWHGAGWTFVAWGGLHGIYLVVNHLWRGMTAGMPGGVAGRVVGRAMTFIAVVVAWVFFRAETFSGALAVLRAMAGGNGIVVPERIAGVLSSVLPAWVSVSSGGLTPQVVNGAVAVVLVTLVGAIALFGPNTQQILWNYRLGLGNKRLTTPPSHLWRWRLQTGWAAATACVAAFGILGMSEKNEFLYFNF